jgi:hypothetical protein
LHQIFVLFINMLSHAGGLGAAIFVSDLPNMRYGAPCYPESRETRLEARRAWTIGRLLDALRGTRILAWSKPNQAESLEFSRKPLKRPDSRKEKIWILLPLCLDFASKNFCFASD